MNILVVEDEKQLLATITGYLRGEGYLCSEAATCAAAEDRLAIGYWAQEKWHPVTVRI